MTTKKTPKKTTKATKKTTKRTKPKTKKATVENGLITVHNPVNPSQEFIVASELADDEAIESELTGKAMESYVYSFKDTTNNRIVTGLTVSGVNEMSRLLTRKKNSGIKIRVVPESVKIESDVEMEGTKGVRVILFAENMLSGETAIGAKFEPYFKKGKKGAYPNTFALEKAVSKAERNAKRKLIPEKVAIETIKKFIKTGNSRQIEAPASQGYIKQPTPQTEKVSKNELFKEAQALINSCKTQKILFEFLDSLTAGRANKLYTKDQREILESMISSKVDELDNK